MHLNTVSDLDLAFEFKSTLDHLVAVDHVLVDWVVERVLHRLFLCDDLDMGILPFLLLFSLALLRLGMQINADESLRAQ